MSKLAHHFTQHLTAWLPVLAWTGVIFLLSAQPSLPGPELFAFDFILKKTAHISVYAVLYLLIYRALAKYTKHTRFQWQIAAIFTFLYALTDEFHQSFVPGRSGTARDLSFDALGILMMWLYQHKYI